MMNLTIGTLAFLALIGPGVLAAEKPNILLLLADDMGFSELGCYGQEVIQTPNLDRLASKGIRFTDFYAGCSVCSPSRAVLMTGLHVGSGTIRGNKGLHPEDGSWDRVSLKKENPTVAEVLQGAGYQTAFIGKWHLGIPGDVSTWAAGRGFDYAVQEQWGEKPEGGDFDERDHWINGRKDMIQHDYTKYDCLDEFRTELALRFLEKKRDKEKPLFLFMSYRSPHAHEFELRETERYKEHGWPEVERRHASRITMLDEQVQRLLDRLDEMGEMENTLVLFTSDNGPHRENGHDDKHFKSSGQYRGYKRDLYEGGVRVPCIAYWKERIAEGKVSGFKAAFWDVMSTFAEAAGTEAPQRTDGISFLPELVGGKVSNPHEYLYWEIQESQSADWHKRAVRVDDWKAVRVGLKGKTELYDLSKDPSETTDVARQFPEVVDRMNARMTKESKKNDHYPQSGGVIK